MTEVRFMAVVGEDRVIRLPAGMTPPEGEVKVILRSAIVAPPAVASSSKEEEDIDSLRDWLLGLAREAEAIDAPPLPSDMAENHDHYAHGAPPMIEVFADAFYFIALLNPADLHHSAAFSASLARPRSVVTTTWVLVEVADALNAPQHRRLVHRFLDEASTPATDAPVIPADEMWSAKGLDLYGARADKSWSLTDCISFAVMTELGLTEALTGDHHFEQAGFRALLKTS